MVCDFHVSALQSKMSKAIKHKKSQMGSRNSPSSDGSRTGSGTGTGIGMGTDASSSRIDENKIDFGGGFFTTGIAGRSLLSRFAPDRPGLGRFSLIFTTLGTFDHVSELSPKKKILRTLFKEEKIIRTD
jgi:hypothetical protein